MKFKPAAAAVGVGIGSSLVLLAISVLAEELQHLVWHALPGGRPA